MAIFSKIGFMWALIFCFDVYSLVLAPNHTKVLFSEVDGWVRGEINDQVSTNT